MAPRDTTNLSLLSNHATLVLSDPDCHGNGSSDANADAFRQNQQVQGNDGVSEGDGRSHSEEDHAGDDGAEPDDLESHYRFLLAGISSPSFEEECRIAMETGAHSEYDGSCLPMAPMHALSYFDESGRGWDSKPRSANSSMVGRRPRGKSRKSANLKVAFTSVSIREYSVIKGDHPCCRQGPALSLGWEICNETKGLDLQTYEEMRITSSPRRSRRDLRLSPSARKLRLSRDDRPAFSAPDSAGQRRVRSKMNPYDSMRSASVPSPSKKALRVPLRSDLGDSAEFEAAWLDEDEKLEHDASGSSLTCSNAHRSSGGLRSRRSSLDHYMSFLESETEQFA